VIVVCHDGRKVEGRLAAAEPDFVRVEQGDSFVPVEIRTEEIASVEVARGSLGGVLLFGTAALVIGFAILLAIAPIHFDG